jgi:25S rRNA (uracil2634-N3)-methyltransferase
MAKGKNLKAALQSQQSRLKVKEKLSHAVQVAEQKARKNGHQFNVASGKGKGRAAATAATPRRTTIPFHSTDRILLIGEGNFSFARALVHDAPPDLEYLPPKNVTATAYDSEEACYEKYPDAKDIVSLLRQKGVEVLFGVDGTTLERVGPLKGRRWDRVVWNFPHAGQSGFLEWSR